MSAGTRERTYFKRFFAVSRGTAAFLLGTLLVCGPAVDAMAEDAEPVKKIDPLLEEDRAHQLSVFSYMQSTARGGRSVPVLVTLNIKGPEGLSAFCEYRPRVLETVLNVFSDDHVTTGDRRAELSDMKAPMLEAINFSLSGETVSSVDIRAGRSVSEFGKEIHQTKLICKKLDGLIR